MNTSRCPRCNGSGSITHVGYMGARSVHMCYLCVGAGVVTEAQAEYEARPPDAMPRWVTITSIAVCGLTVITLMAILVPLYLDALRNLFHAVFP